MDPFDFGPETPLDQCFECGREAKPGETFIDAQVEENTDYPDGVLSDVAFCSECFDRGGRK